MIRGAYIRGAYIILHNKDTKIMIEHCRVVCDLKSLFIKTNKKESTLVRLKESKGLITDSGTVKSVSDDDLTKMHREFVSLVKTDFIKPLLGQNCLILRN